MWCLCSRGSLQEAQAGAQQRPLDGVHRHHIARKWIINAESARRPHPNHSILPHTSQAETSNHIHTGQFPAFPTFSLPSSLVSLLLSLLLLPFTLRLCPASYSRLPWRSQRPVGEILIRFREGYS